LITGSAIDLTIEDNGKGFDMDDRFDLASLLSNNHFGLAGMVERAHLIEAEITIQSKIETGTTIRIRWIKSV
jgi:signal transduction histidine kinase